MIRNSLNFIANTSYDEKYEQALPVFTEFMVKWAFKDLFEKLTINLFTQMRVIVKRGKSALYLHKSRRDALLGPMWNENYMHLSDILVSKGNAA
jgi:hypothetical protein